MYVSAFHRARNPASRFRGDPRRSGEIRPLACTNLLESNPPEPRVCGLAVRTVADVSLRTCVHVIIEC